MPTLEELAKLMESRPEPSKLSTSFWKAKIFFKDLYYNLSPRKLKQLSKLIKIWYNTWGYDFCDILFYLKFGTENLISGYEKQSNHYEGQDDDYKNLIEFKKSIENVIEDETQENVDDMCERMKQLKSWWI